MKNKISALVFDVFGTVVDWHSSISREIRTLAEKKKFTINFNQFATDWRAGYKPAMDRVRSGDLPWMNIDALHRLILDELIIKYEITQLSNADKTFLNSAWHRLDPWEDSIEGLKKLKSTYIIGTLSNGNMSLLVNMAKYSGLPWDCILSAELFGHYKPDAEVYQGSAKLLDLPRQEVMMVAAHTDDLDHAMQSGLKTAFVARPYESGQKTIIKPSAKYDYSANDFNDLYNQLT